MNGPELHVVWADGHRTVLTNGFPCAACVNKFTGQRMLNPETIPPDIRAEHIELVGRYAIKVRWSDGHSTGIYTFQRLRAWCPCESCHGPRA